ncbi:MAG: hypothetical protein NTY53_23265, partial [Kiritimatiellaeota bacterium]|nr:hypothetical protein [Kiritimatiellota bacterium]
AGSVASPPRTLGAITWRFVHQQDLVPRVPSALLGYCHVGKMLYYNSACELIPNELADNHRCQDFIQAMTYHLRITPLTPEPLKVSNIDSQATSKFMSVIKAIKPSWELLRHTKYLFIPIGIDVILALIQAGFDHVNEHYVCIFPSLKPSPLPPQHVKLDCKTIIIMPLQIVAAILIVMLMLVFWFAGLMACAGWFLLKWFWRACQ